MSKLIEQINKAPRVTKKLGEVVGYIADNRGKNPSYYVESGVPVIDNFMITGKRSVDLSLTKRFLDEKTYKEFIRKEIKKDDVLVTLVGNGFGQIALAPEERSVIIQNTVGLRSNDLSLNSYLFYLLSKYKEAITGLDRGAAQPSVKVGDLLDIEIDLPDFPIQKKIASILSAYDEKIENNNKIIKNLEETAQTIFNEWFVNFKFPGYEKVKMIDSEMGEIPEGWEIKNVLDVIERISPGKKYDNKSASPSGSVPILDQGASGFIGYHDDEPGVVASIDNPVIVFTNHTCYYRILTEPFSCIQNILPYIGKNGYDTFFVYFLTKEKIKMSEYKGHWPEFEQQVFVIPTPEIANQFSKLAKVFIEKIVTCEKEKTSLRSQRDQLLAKLI